MQELCLEYKNVEYYSFFLKALNDFLRKKKNRTGRKETKNKKPHRGKKKSHYEIQTLGSIQNFSISLGYRKTCVLPPLMGNIIVKIRATLIITFHRLK